MVRPTVNSNKHYVQQSLATVLGGAQLNIVIADGIDAPGSSPIGVRVGSSIKAVFIEMWARGSELSPGTVLMTFYKKGAGDAAITLAEAASLHTYNNKKNIFYHTQGLSNDTDSTATPFIRQWFKIPKGKQRMGLNDQLQLNVFSQGAIDQVICGFMTYKEYF